jgi:CBS domain-containing protein
MKVEEIMTRKVITLNEWDNVSDIAKTLLKHNLTGAPVLDRQGKLVGIVTEGDLMRRNALVHLPTYIAVLDSSIYLESPEALKESLEKAVGVLAEEVMTKEVFTALPEDDVQIIATKMIEDNYNPVPVVDKSGKLAGIISKSDIVRLIIK